MWLLSVPLMSIATALCAPTLDVLGHGVSNDVIQDVTAQSERDVVALVDVLGTRACPPDIHIDVVSSMESASSLDPPFHVPAWAAGAAVPNERRIVVGVTSERRVQNRHATLTHELAHVLVRHATGDVDVPRWFDEGAARVLAKEAGNADDLRALSQAKIASRLWPLSAIADGFPAGPTDAAVAYAVSGRAVELMFAERPMSAFFASLDDTQSFDESVAATTGRAVWQLSQDTEKSVSTWRSLLVVGFETDILMGVSAILLTVSGIRARRRFLAGLRRLADEDGAVFPTGPPVEVIRWTVARGT
jgi:hypothetical protein